MVGGQRVGYIRVSSIDQNPDRQLEGVHVDRVFTDRASGGDANRPQLEALIGFVRDRDVSPSPATTRPWPTSCSPSWAPSLSSSEH